MAVGCGTVPDQYKRPLDTFKPAWTAPPRWLTWVAAGLVAALSVVVRAKMLMAGPGVYGLGNYDDGVHDAGLPV